MINYLGSEMDSRSEITSRLISNIITNRTFNNKLTFLSSTLRTGEIGSKYGEEFLEILKNDYKIISLNNVISNSISSCNFFIIKRRKQFRHNKNCSNTNNSRSNCSKNNHFSIFNNNSKKIYQRNLFFILFNFFQRNYLF